LRKIPIKYVPLDVSGHEPTAPYFNPVEEVQTTLLEGTPTVTLDHFHYDAFLNLDREQHGGTGLVNPKRTIVTTYARLRQSDIVALPISKEVFDDGEDSAKLVAKHLYFYDDISSDCARVVSGQPARGTLTRIQQWLSPEFKTKHDRDPEYWKGYDEYGNQVCTRDARGNIRRFSFDDSHTYTTSVVGPIAKQKLELNYYGVGGIRTREVFSARSGPWSTIMATDLRSRTIPLAG